MQDYIYIIVMRTGTYPAKLFRVFTKKPYTHVSLSGDINLSEMYSFCRTYTPFPLPATFNREIVGEGTLGQFDYIPCEIYRIPVTHEQKEIYNMTIRHFINNRENYSYNLSGLIALYLNISWKREHSFVCSQFVAYTMDKIGIPLEKPFCLYKPDDFRRFPDAELIYSGELNQFHDERVTHAGAEKSYPYTASRNDKKSPS